MSERERTEGATGSTRRQWLAQMGGLAAGAGLSALGGTAARPAWAQGQPKRGGVLKVATVDKPVNMDPGYAQLYSSLQVYQNVYNKLVYVDDKGQFVPGLARSWKADGDKAWVFDLVDNAVFHNGEAFTARTWPSRSTGCSMPRTSCRCACSSRRWRAWRPSARTRCASA
jgi:peptide/nickel transport system substrate-binding protein